MTSVIYVVVPLVLFARVWEDGDMGGRWIVGICRRCFVRQDFNGGYCRAADRRGTFLILAHLAALDGA